MTPRPTRTETREEDNGMVHIIIDAGWLQPWRAGRFIADWIAATYWR